MSSTNLLKILFFIFVAFAVGEIVFTVQRYGLPKLDLFKPHPGSCLILEEKNCKLVQFINNPNSKGDFLAVYHIPKGSTLFAPADGFYSNTPTFFFRKDEFAKFLKYHGVTIITGKNNTSEAREIRYSFIFTAEKVSSYDFIKKGSIIGTVSDKDIESLGSYNLVVGITKQTSYKIFNGQPHEASASATFVSYNDKLKEILSSH